MLEREKAAQPQAIRAHKAGLQVSADVSESKGSLIKEGINTFNHAAKSVGDWADKNFITMSLKE